MKKQFISTKASVVRFGAAFLLLLNLSTASANGVNKGEEPFVAVKYVGLVEQRAQFQVDLINDNEEAYLLTVQEEDGSVLYREKITRKIFSKKFEWNNLDHNSSKLVFTVTGEKSKKAQVFEVASQVRTVQDVVVTKM
jgi:hypothetical protein